MRLFNALPALSIIVFWCVCRVWHGFVMADMAEQNRRYQQQVERLHSFEDWPITARIDPVILAQAGFYYTGHGDQVRCFQCKINICGWTEHQDPLVEHRQWSSRCPFVVSQLGSQARRAVRLTEKDYPLAAMEGAGQDDDGERQQARFNLDKLLSLGLIVVKPPVHGDLATLSARLRTFDTWSAKNQQTPEKLAAAGFYSLGKEDWVCCYHCNICLREWCASDDPWQEHARWAPRCYFLLMMKGQAFIDEATAIGKIRQQPHPVSVPFTRAF